MAVYAYSRRIYCLGGYKKHSKLQPINVKNRLQVALQAVLKLYI